MIIFSFDCAIKNLGFCCLEINTDWKDQNEELIEEIYKFYDRIEEFDNKALLDEMRTLADKADALVESILSIKYLQIFDLVSDHKVKEVSYSEIVKRLKYILYCLGKQLPEPDVVLIEHQMHINDKARGISRYIEDYYTPVQKIKAPMTYAIEAYPLLEDDLTGVEPNCKVYCVGPSLKNSYQTDPSKAGSYQRFIEKYNSNYAANKAHAVYNFKYFLKTRDLDDVIKGINNKLDDISDAFMQAYAWCRLHGYF